MSEEIIALTLTLHAKIADISATDWDACAGINNPFVSHAFLLALEESGSTGSGTGWLPQHMALRDSSGQMMAVVPLYVKLHSYGEYVFDHSWAEAFERAGGTYYPKLQIGIPFSPVPGPRLLCRSKNPETIASIGEALIQTCTKASLSSAHITFCHEDEWRILGQAGWLQRLGVQFHWHNKNYTSFDDFLGQMSSRHRKSIKRERREANNCGLVFMTLTGDEITPRHWDAFYHFYQATVDRKWGSAYLTRAFFNSLSKNLGSKIVLMMAEHKGVLIAGALNLIGDDTLYGRNWGCVGEWPFLHFELCYYRAIDYAISHGLKRVEAGAQGDHKIQRGYLPQLTYSVHWLADQGFSHAVEKFLTQERLAVQSQMADLREFGPFKASEPHSIVSK